MMPADNDRLARYYDLVHADAVADIPLLLGLAEETGGPILELGAGSGRTLVPLARAGFTVVGLDNSEAMLARARRRLAAAGLQKRSALVLGEMADFDLGRQFPLVTVPFNTWMHLPNSQAQSAALRCIARHLTPGGRLLIALPAPAAITGVEHDGALVLERTFDDPETGELVLQFSSTQLDEVEQTLSITWIYDRIGADETVRRTLAPMKLRYLFRQEAELLLEESGLSPTAVWGDNDRSPYTAGSEHLIILAEKPAP